MKLKKKNDNKFWLWKFFRFQILQYHNSGKKFYFDSKFLIFPRNRKKKIRWDHFQKIFFLKKGFRNKRKSFYQNREFPIYSFSFFINLNFSKLCESKKKLVFFIAEKKALDLTLFLIEKLLFGKKNLKIVLVSEKEILNFNSFFDKIKNIRAKNKSFKILKPLEKGFSFSQRKNLLKNPKLLRKKIGSPEIGKVVFIFGLKEKKNSFLTIVNQIGFSKTNLKIFYNFKKMMKTARTEKNIFDKIISESMLS
mmetsp:Transcript_14043/g.27915  ORF Transcript_14043/g.27915 Transcript_14043/m.27915 type:complete len:251 (-) Transcript_14043:1369-2121(-)